MHTLFYMFSWLLSTDPMHYNIRQSVCPLRTRLELFSVSGCYTVFGLHTNALPLKNNQNPKLYPHIRPGVQPM